MSHVYIAFDPADADVAERLARALELAGLKPLRAGTVRSGEAHDEAMEAALKAAKAVVVLWTRRSVASRRVRAEASFAERQGILLPAMAEPCERPVMFELVQTADLSDWTDGHDHPALRAFLAEVRCLATGDCDRMSPVELATSTEMRLPTKPSIAVLPLSDLAERDDDHFADGITEELAIALSRFSALFVIAGQSSLAYRGTTKPAQTIARELGVRYVLEGSVRRSGGRVRIAAKLIDAIAGEQIWAERFDDDAGDVFALQERVATSVAAAIASTITDVEMRRSMNARTRSADARALTHRARSAMIRFNREANQEAIALAEEALSFDPNHVDPMAILAMAHANEFRRQWGDDPAASLERALLWCERALQAPGGNDNESVLATIAGARLNLFGPDPQVRQLIERAMALNPNHSLVLFWSAQIDWILGDFACALERFETLIRINPRALQRPVFLTGMGNCLYFLDRHREAVVVQEEVLRAFPTYQPSLLVAAVAHAALGDPLRARALAARLEQAGGIEAGLRDFVGAQRHQLHEAWEQLVGARAAA